MSVAASFYQAVVSKRGNVGEFNTQANINKAALYINNAYYLARALKIEDFVIEEPIDFSGEIERFIVEGAFYRLEDYINKMYAEIIYELDGNLKANVVILDEDWRARISTYLHHIRGIIRRADISEALKESILQKISRLENDVERKRTAIQSYGETFTEICKAVGQGAKDLEPAIKLLSRVTGSLSNAKEESDQKSRQLLPKPEELGLEELQDQATEVKSSEQS